VPAANAKQISAVEYGINAQTESGTVAGPFTPGATATIILTNAMNNQIANGQAVSIYLAACNDAGLCSAWAGPTAQVIPYGPIANPAVSAVANGTSIAYTWSAQSDGLAETLNVCINGGCTNYNVPATGGYNGNSTANVGYSAKGTITAYLTDTAGQRAPAAGTVTATATTAANPTVAIGQGGAASDPPTCTMNCKWVTITIAGFPANSTVNYNCQSSNSGSFDKNDRNSAGVVQKTNGSGGASFATECKWGYWNNSSPTLTMTVTVGGVTASASDTG